MVRTNYFMKVKFHRFNQVAHIVFWLLNDAGPTFVAVISNNHFISIY